MRGKRPSLFEIALVFVRLDHVATRVVMRITASWERLLRARFASQIYQWEGLDFTGTTEERMPRGDLCAGGRRK
jgi:hypothetical protein